MSRKTSTGHIRVSLVEVIRGEGIPFTETTKGCKFRCPFHSDRDPSAYAYRNTNRFYCFGCGERGDAIDFIMKLKGLDFKDALAYLGIEGSRGKSIQKRLDQKETEKRTLVKAFREWEQKCHDELATIYRTAHKVMKGFKTMEQAEEFATLYYELPLMEHRMEILVSGSDDVKYQLFKEVGGEL